MPHLTSKPQSNHKSHKLHIFTNADDPLWNPAGMPQKQLGVSGIDPISVRGDGYTSLVLYNLQVSQVISAGSHVCCGILSIWCVIQVAAEARS